MVQDPTVSTIAHVIQLSVAPVFLLSAIGGMLAVMTNRLSRVVDRARTLEMQLVGTVAELDPALREELSTLSKRARLVGFAITLCTITALLVCSVIATLFLGAFLTLDTSVPVAVFFVAAVVAFFLGLLSFLREVLLATASLRIAGLRVHRRWPST